MAVIDPTKMNSPPGSEARTIYRHTAAVRIMHWINVLCLYVLLLSGLQIFNAHSALYWGEASHFDTPLLEITAVRTPEGELRGVTRLLGYSFNTTGFLGVSGGGDIRAFPAWLTIPGSQWLAMGRRWHFFFAWIFVINGLLYAIYALWSRHLRRDLMPTRRDWRGIGRSIIDHALLRHPRGEAAARYNVLQKLAYLIVIFLFGPVMVLMGLAMSPRMDTVLEWLLELIGGRQSARTLHFVLAFGFVVFVFIHLFEVIVTGPWNNLRSIITGRYRIPAKKKPEEKNNDQP